MDDVSVFLEHVHLFYRLDGLDIEFLERSLQFLVVCSRRLVHFLRPTSWRSLPSAVLS